MIREEAKKAWPDGKGKGKPVDVLVDMPDLTLLTNVEFVKDDFNITVRFFQGKSVEETYRRKTRLLRRDVDVLLEANSDGKKWVKDSVLNTGATADYYGLLTHWTRDDGMVAIMSSGESLMVSDGGRAQKAERDKKDKAVKPPTGF